MVNQYRPLNPKCSEESLRCSAISTLGIATIYELEGLKNYKVEQERALQASIDEKLRSDAIKALKLAKVAEHDALHKPALREWSLGIDTASSNGRKGKVDGFIGTQAIKGISNHMVTCLQHLKTHGGVDQLKVISFSECDLAERDILYFTAKTELYPLSLNYLDLSCNRMGDIGVSYLFTGFFHLRVSVLHPTHNIISLNLSKNNIGHMGHIADYIRDGYVPHLKVLNLADNNITDTGALNFVYNLTRPSFSPSGWSNDLKVLHLEGNKIRIGPFSHPIAKLVGGIKGGIKVLVSRVSDTVDGVKKQGNLLFGSKENKKEIIKDFLKQAQENGVDVKNVAVSKDIWGKLDSIGFFISNLSIGWIKCTVVPENVKSFAADQIVAKASKKVGVINTAMDIVACYFESFDENASSEQGLQFIGDVGLVTQEELLDSIK